MIFLSVFDAKMEGLEKPIFFVLYLLQLKRFRWIMKVDEKKENERPQDHPKSKPRECFYDFDRFGSESDFR